jgi:hypothetical protein
VGALGPKAVDDPVSEAAAAPEVAAVEADAAWPKRDVVIGVVAGTPEAPNGKTAVLVCGPADSLPVGSSLPAGFDPMGKPGAGAEPVPALTDPSAESALVAGCCPNTNGKAEGVPALVDTPVDESAAGGSCTISLNAGEGAGVVAVPEAEEASAGAAASGAAANGNGVAVGPAEA